MRTVITYITDDGKQFFDVFRAKKHECELTEHKWDYYKEGLAIQKGLDEADKESVMRFCNKCTTQEIIKE